MIGYAFCGSFCTLSASIAALRVLAEESDVQPIFSETVAATDTRFYMAADFCAEVEEICRRRAIRTVAEAEPLGPRTPLELLIVAPCTGNTLAKLAHGITDTSVTMAMKAHLRTDRPLLLALASNDALAANLPNLGRLSVRRSVYFVPMKQDDPSGKPSSLVADFSRLPEAYRAAREGRQLRPMFL
jgi:dipicolinate synthase subunit B